MIARQIEEETLAYCGAEKIGVICYSPMCKGLLTGTFDRARAEALPVGTVVGLEQVLTELC